MAAQQLLFIENGSDGLYPTPTPNGDPCQSCSSWGRLALGKRCCNGMAVGIRQSNRRRIDGL